MSIDLTSKSKLKPISSLIWGRGVINAAAEDTYINAFWENDLKNHKFDISGHLFNFKIIFEIIKTIKKSSDSLTFSIQIGKIGNWMIN